jgi:SAM-dependent methyltransferase
VITPSYAPDVELCSALNASVLRNTPGPVRHYIITPARDVKLFSRLRGTRTEVLSVDEVLPWHVLPVPGANFWLNLRRPWPPVRGWVMQQIIKLEMAAKVNADLLLLADSDVVLVRPVTGETFRAHGRTRFYRREKEIGSDRPRHVRWNDVACMLLGVPPEPPPLPDYISPFNVWDRRIAVALQERIQQTTGKHWLDAVAAQLHFSEFVLYGVFADKVLGGQVSVTDSDSMFCHNYWKRTPLDIAAGERFLREMPEQDVAIMISAKSGTPLEVRQRILAPYLPLEDLVRDFLVAEFDKAFGILAEMRWQEEAQYYPRYRNRYLAILRKFAALASKEGLDILEIGGGQLTFLSTRLWEQDKACVADINDQCFPSLQSNDIDTVLWNLASEDSPIARQFDVVFFSEVIEHLPVPGHVALERLRARLRPGGLLLCSTPNLYRLRNVIFLATGRRIFDHFGLPGVRGYGHILEYSAEHLGWQFEQAGFTDVTIEFRQFARVPNKPVDRVLAALGAPLLRIPRYRDNLLAEARA